jgi:hypothetical protein
LGIGRHDKHDGYGQQDQTKGGEAADRDHELSFGHSFYSTGSLARMQGAPLSRISWRCGGFDIRIPVSAAFLSANVKSKTALESYTC